MFDARAVLGIVLYFKEKILKPLRKDGYLNRCNLPTLRTETDIGSENPETTAVSGFFRAIFQGGIQKISFPQNDLWGGLELNLKTIPVEKFKTL